MFVLFLSFDIVKQTPQMPKSFSCFASSRSIASSKNFFRLTSSLSPFLHTPFTRLPFCAASSA